MAYQLLQDCNDMNCDMTSTEHAVLMVLCRYANEDGRECFPSTSEIARCSHFAAIPVRKALASLQAAGWITADQKPGMKRFFTVDAARIRAAVGKGVPLQDYAGGINQDPRIDQYPPKDQDPRIDQSSDPVLIDTPTPYRSIPRKEQEENKEENTTDIRTKLDDVPPPSVEDFGFVPAELPEAAPKAKRSAPIPKPEGVSDEDWADYKRLRREKRLPLTAKALKGLQLEADKAGKTMKEVVDICLENSWAGFKASWLKNLGRQAASAPAPKSFSEIDYSVGINPDGSF